MRFTRRVLLAGATAVAARPAEEPAVRLPRKLRIGIYGTEGHVDEIKGQLGRLPDVSVAAVAGAARREVEALARTTGAKIYPDLLPMLEAEKLDVVAVTNNDGERARAVLACLGRGLNVIAEKPLALNRPDLDRIRQVVEQRNLHLGMLLPMRFQSNYRAMRQVVRAGSIGEVAQVAAQKSYKAGSRAAWYLKRSSYGGTIAWIGIHMIDLMRFTTGRDIVAVSGLQAHIGFPELGEMENVTASMFRFDNGAVGTLRMDYLRSPKAATHGDDRLRIAGTRGIVEWDQAKGVVLMTAENAGERMGELPAAGSVFVDYLEHVYTGKATELPLSDIWRDNEITIAAQNAADHPNLRTI